MTDDGDARACVFYVTQGWEARRRTWRWFLGSKVRVWAGRNHRGDRAVALLAVRLGESVAQV